jgi:pilus assembly protein Flp/PilA
MTGGLHDPPVISHRLSRMENEADMAQISALLEQFARDEAGATAIEYALIAAIIGVGIAVSLRGYGNSIANSFTDTADRYKQAAQ